MTIAAAVALALAAAGCGTSPTAPLAGGDPAYTPPAGPEVLKVSADGSTSFVTLPPALQSAGPVAEADFDPTRGLTTTVLVDGLLGGRVVCGRFVATVPPGAFDGVGTITMSVPDSTLMVCNLEIAPADLNGFLLPVGLALHTSGTDADLDSLDVYWYDPAKSTWTSMGGLRATLEPVLADETQTLTPVEGVQVELSHFSTYAAGKAGW